VPELWRVLQVSCQLSLPETRRRKPRSIQVHRLPHQTASVQEVSENETGTDPSPLWILLHGILRVRALGVRESAQDSSTLSRLIATAQCTNTLERPNRLFEGRWRQDDHPHRLECPASMRTELCRVILSHHLHCLSLGIPSVWKARRASRDSSRIRFLMLAHG